MSELSSLSEQFVHRDQRSRVQTGTKKSSCQRREIKAPGLIKFQFV